jgi:hypothetical protein
MTIVVTIKAKRNGFRRCGVAHSDKPTTWQQGDFTSEQWEALLKEPQLIITYEIVDLDSVLEQSHELTSFVTPPQAPNTPEAAQPQAFEADAAPLGDVLANGEPKFLGVDLAGSDTLGAGRTGRSDASEQLKDQPSAAIETVQQEAAAPVAKPEKTRSSKAKDADK